MKSKTLFTAVLAAVMATCLSTAALAKQPTYKMTTDIPVSITTPDQVNTSIGALEFFDGVPTKNTVDTVYDYVDRARAVEVFINMIPAVSMYHLRQGMRDIGLTEANQIVIAEDMGDSKPLVLTRNNTSLYTWARQSPPQHHLSLPLLPSQNAGHRHV